MLFSVKYTDDMPENFGGQAFLWMIKLRPKYLGKPNIFQHEWLHVMMMWICAVITAVLVVGLQHWLQYSVIYVLLALPLSTLTYSALYGAIRPFRLWSEVLCYRRQLDYSPPEDVEYLKGVYAGFIADPKRYNLNITKEEALKLL